MFMFPLENVARKGLIDLQQGNQFATRYMYN